MKKERSDSNCGGSGSRDRVPRDTVRLSALVLALYHLALPVGIGATSPDQAKRDYFDFLFKNPDATTEQRNTSFDKFRREGSDAQIQGARERVLETRIARKKSKLKKSPSFSLAPVPQASPSVRASGKRKNEGSSSGSRSASGGGASIDPSTIPDVLDFTNRPQASPSAPSSE